MKRARSILSLVFLLSALVCASGCQDTRAPAATARAEQPAAAPPETSRAAEPPPVRDAAPDTKPASETAAGPAPEPPKTVKPAAAAARLDITFDTLKFDMPKGSTYQSSMLTPKIKELEGRRVRLRGYILPSFQQTGLMQFVLVRDNMQCCFGPGAALYDCVVVEMLPGRSTDFTIRPVAVEGIFSIREFPDPEGKMLAIYHLDGESVR